MNMTIRKAVKQYLEWKVTHTTVAGSRYAVRLNHFAKYIGNNTKIKKLKGEDIVRFHKRMKDLDYSLATISYSANILKNFFDFWKGRGESKLNPKEIISVKFISPDKDIVTEEDLEDMDLAFDEKDIVSLQRKLIIHMLWDTGMRVSELVDMDFSSLENRHPETGLRYAKVRTRKSMRYNLVVWGSETNRLLEKYLGYRLLVDTENKAIFINLYKSEYNRITSRTIQRMIKQTIKLVGIEKNITPHSFRHGKAHQLLNKGGHIEDVQKILRHVSLESSLHYVNINPMKYMQLASKYLA